MKQITITKDNGTTHQLFNSDFFDVELDIKPNLILTDPPFNTTCASWDQPIDLEAMWKWMKPLREDRTPVLLFGQLPFDKMLGCSNLRELKYE